MHGDPRRIRDYLQRHCDCHPLVTGIVAGLVADYLPARGDFDAWAADPDQAAASTSAGWTWWKRNHILHSALTALSEPSRQLLSTLTLMSEAVDYDTLAALNPHLPREPNRVAEPANVEDQPRWKDLSEKIRQWERLRHEAELARYRNYQRAHRAWQSSPEFGAAAQKLAGTARIWSGEGCCNTPPRPVAMIYTPSSVPSPRAGCVVPSWGALGSVWSTTSRPGHTCRTRTPTASTTCAMA